MNALCIQRDTGGEPCAFQCNGCAHMERYERMMRLAVNEAACKAAEDARSEVDDDLYPEKESE
jgi:hypothetical protein